MTLCTVHAMRILAHMSSSNIFISLELDGYDPSSFGGDEVERKAASGLLTDQDAMNEPFQARGDMDAWEKENKATFADAVAVNEISEVVNRE